MLGVVIGTVSDWPKPNRSKKGKSCIGFPTSYCVVDLETTGLSADFDEIIEIGAIKYQEGVEVDRFQTLVKPEYPVDSFITELTGITNQMLADAPKIDAVIGDFESFVGDLIVVGYNVSFDVNFLYDNFMQCMEKPFPNDFIDCLRMARKLHPDMPHHRLKDLAELYGLDCGNAHRTIADCLLTQQCYEHLQQEAIQQYGDADAFADAFNRKKPPIRAADIQGDEEKADPSSPIYQKHCVFTGKLERFTRKEAMQIVADIGGINENSVTKKTNFLVLGNNDYCALIKDGKSAKHKKAEKLKLEGQDIEILPEDAFYSMLDD